MIVDEIDLRSVVSVELENYSPVSGHSHRKLALPVALQCMEIESWDRHICRLGRGLQRIQQALGSGPGAWEDARSVTPLPKLAQPLMTEVSDHAFVITVEDQCKASRYIAQAKVVTV